MRYLGGNKRRIEGGGAVLRARVTPLSDAAIPIVLGNIDGHRFAPPILRTTLIS
ncbi:hypothetical protein [Iodobacter fluviatilis]|uniref:hypothetical protein n=1 Tax=Iodobacter fluviatilis TaxID=537 RepID=UPI00165E7663|nr:hypothetical protein [Iodobacter fluviatilis]